VHPGDLIAHKAAEENQADQYLASNPKFRAELEVMTEHLESTGMIVVSDDKPPLGDWPAQPLAPSALTIVEDGQTGAPYDTVYIVLVPTDDWTTVPAYFRWGNWNANPPAEHHVAALRSWHDRYGAELIGLSSDTMNIRVSKRPSSRKEALALAREHYAYCNDIIDQGYGNLSALAAALMAHDWWYFWWD
jgi:hypothetical protein